MNEFSRRIAAPGLATLQDTERQMRPAAPAPAPQQPQEPQGVPVLTAFEDIARATGVPVNVLIADERINTAETAEQAVEIGRQAAEELRPHFAEGRGLTDALRAATGDDRRARQWADAALARGRELYPDRFPENSNAENIARAGGSAAIEGTGYVADYAADVGEQIGWAAGGNVILQLLRAPPVQNVLRATGDLLRGAGNRVRQGMDTEALEALRQSTPQGDITDPSSWNLGENPSLEGYTLLAANVFGSLLPVVLASAGGPLSAMAVGGAQGAGAATDQAREIVWQAFDEGTLADSSAYYNSLLQAGFSEQEAARRTADAAGQLAGQMTLPVSALGGLATERILSGVTSRVAGGPLAARMVGGAVVGAAEEGTQEAAEGVTARVGVNVGAQGPLTNPTEETFGDFLMGAIGGAPVGMAGGARSPGVPRGADDDLLDEQLPPEAQPAPAPSSPMGPQEAGPAGVSPVGPPPTTPPQGPLSTAAARAPDRGVGGLEAGQPVTIYSPETGNTHQAEFIGETAEGVVVRVGEQEFVFDDEMLAAGIEIRDATGAMPVPQSTQMPDPRSEALGYDQTAINEDQGRYDEPTAAEQSIEAMIAARWEERGNQITEDIQRDLQRIADEARSQNIRATLDSFVNRRLAELEQQRGTATMDPAEVDALVGTMPEDSQAANDVVGLPEPNAEQPGTSTQPTASAPQQDIGQDVVSREATADATQEGLSQPGVTQERDLAPTTSMSGRRAGSWFVVDRETGALVTEIQDANRVDEINFDRYEPIPAEDFLGEYNAAIKAEGGDQNANAIRQRIAEAARARRQGAQQPPRPRQERTEIDRAADEAEQDVRRDYGSMTRQIITTLRRKDIKIDPEGTAGLDLKSAGVTPRTAPGLFKRGGLKDLDNLVAGDFPSLQELVQTDEQTGYFDLEDLKAAIRDEVAGSPRLSAAMREAQGVRDLAERQQRLRDDVESWASENNVSDLTAEEKAEMVQILLADEDMEIEDAAERVFIRSEANGEWNAADESQPDGEEVARQPAEEVPFDEADARGQEGGQSSGVAGRADQPGERQSEQTPEGEQLLIDGVAPVTDRERAEAQTRRPMRGGNAATDFGLFDTGARAQGDMFAAPVDQAAQEADPEPTDGQKAAGNYKLGHAKVYGFDVSIENAKGSERRGRDSDGEEWSVTMPAHYGYIKRTEGADGDHVDVYVAEGAPAERIDGAPVFVVNQVDPDTRAFDEHKAVLGVSDEAAAAALYDAGFSDGRGPERRESVTQMTVAEFRKWLEDGDQSKPADTPEARWDAMSEQDRADVLKRTSFVGKRGDLLKPAQNSLKRSFADLGKKVKEEVEAALSGDAGPAAAAKGKPVISEANEWADRMAEQVNQVAYGINDGERYTSGTSPNGEAMIQWGGMKNGRFRNSITLIDKGDEETAGPHRIKWATRKYGDEVLVRAESQEADDAALMALLAEAEKAIPELNAKARPDAVGYRADKDRAEYGKGPIFPAPATTVSLPKRAPFISQAEAAERLAGWKETAKRIGKEQDNSNKVIISLFDESGAWSQPWRDAGYDVYQYDAALGDDIFNNFPMADIQEIAEAGKTVHGVLSACPCTTFAGSGARWWSDRHDANDVQMVEKLFGRHAAKNFDSPVEANAWMVHMTAAAIEFTKPNFHVLENPIGRIGEMSGLPDPLVRFHPHHFGDAYTKRTQLWGDFATDMPLANVDPVDGSKMQSKLRGDRPEDKKARSLTPEGFAYAFFMANDPDARAALQGAETLPAATAGQETETSETSPEPAKTAPQSNAGQEKPGPSFKGQRKDNTSILTMEEQDRLAELRNKFRAKTRDQLSAGLDPELVAIAAEMAGIYIKAGARKFRDLVRAMMEDLGLSFDQVQPYARGAYNQVRDDMDLDGQDVSDMDSATEVMAEIRAMRAEAQETADVSGPGGDLEQDRGDATPQDGMGAADVPAAGGVDAEGARPGGGATGQGVGQRETGRRISGRGPDLFGEGGDQQVSRPDGDGAQPSARRNGVGRGSDRQRGRAVDQSGAEEAARRATDRPGVKDRRAQQREADRLDVVPADEASVRETLPLLLPEQQDDVLKVERRFAKPDGHGMLLTNGTGTGKTYSGGGVIKRFAQQGKTNTLILAPSQGILDAWVDMGKDMGLDISKLADTNTAGDGIVATTYANAADNISLIERQWDLVVSDESHNLSSNQAGDATAALRRLRAITHHPDGIWEKAHLMLSDEWAAAREMPEGAPRDMRFAELRDQEKGIRDRLLQEPRSKVLFLSATPFAYDKNTDYAAGYLFDYPSDGTTDSGSRQSGRNLFMVQNFGYRIRYHKLTQPEAAVDRGVFEREFHEKLKREGALSGRSLSVDADYDRRFVLTDSEVGRQIDEALDYLNKQHPRDAAAQMGWSQIRRHVTKNFDYLKRMQLLEAIKAEKAIPDIRAHLEAGRKVVVFHDYNVGGGRNPFLMSFQDGEIGYDQYQQFLRDVPFAQGLKFGHLKPPKETITQAFGDRAREYNGTVSNKLRQEAKLLFNTDGSGVDVLVVQSAAGEAGISLHDVTGTHQRALINLGMPTRPVTTLQQEGRIRRVGSVSDAIFRYYTIDTAWERGAFAQRIAERSGTVENLALGNEARSIRESFIDAYTEADQYPVGMEGEGKGGKERDRSVALTSPFDQAKTHYYGRSKNTRRRSQRQGVDFFATPEPLGFKMAAWAGVREYERVLEPSAGDGAIARYFPEHADRTIIEPSFELSTQAQLRTAGARAITEQFEDHHINNKYDAVVMNPPFGSGGKTAREHVQKAMQHVRPGGRVIALIPTGPAADKQFEKLFDSDRLKESEWSTVAEIALPSVAFERAGTAVRTRILILDRTMGEGGGQTRRMDLTNAETVAEFFDRIEDLDVPPRPEPMVEPGALAETTMESDEAAITVDVSRSEEDFDLSEFKHTQTGETIYVAATKERTSRDAYEATISVAKKHGGWWNRYQSRRVGAQRGFAFPSLEQRDAFIAEMGEPIDLREQRALTHPTNPMQTVFYSPLLRAVQGAKQKQAPAKDWKAILAKLPGVKQIEIEWLGVYEWLDSQEGAQVPREAVEQFIRDGQIELVEERLAGDEDRRDLTVDVDYNNFVEPDWEAEAELYLDEAREELEDRLDEDEGASEITDADVQDRAEELARQRWQPTEFAADVYDRNSGDYVASGYWNNEAREYNFPDLSMYGGTLEDVIEAAEEYLDGQAVGPDEIDGPASFEDYTEGGGEDYREVLLRVPNLHETGRNRVEPADRKEVDRINREMQQVDRSTEQGRERWRALQQQREDARLEAIRAESAARKRPFAQRAHFQQENIVVHARLKDRKGPNGEDILFIEEIQSDLASKWRENTESPEVTARRRDLERERDAQGDEFVPLLDAAKDTVAQYVRDEFGPARVTEYPPSEAIKGLFSAMSHSDTTIGSRGAIVARAALRERDGELYDRLFELARRRRATQEAILALGTERSVDPSLPDTPFKEEHTYALMVKRLVREAAEKGYDRVAWTPGYMQAERWNKAAQSVVEKVYWRPLSKDILERHSAEYPGLAKNVGLRMADGGGMRTFYVDSAGQILLAPESKDAEGKNLSSLIGPKLTQQVMTEEKGEVGGQKITFPDSGYAIAYDQQVRKAMEKLAKGTGAKVEVATDLPDFQPSLRPYRDRVMEMAPQEFVDRAVQISQSATVGDAYERFLGRAQEILSEGFDDDYKKALLADAAPRSLLELMFDVRGNPVWSITITPELREKALQAQPILQKPDFKAQTATLMDEGTVRELMPELRARLDAVNLKNVRLGLDSVPGRQGATLINRLGKIDILIGASLNPAQTLYHEAIHALRAMDLFTASEWSRLEQAARNRWLAEFDIARRYPDLSPEQQIEEAIAEAFGQWAAGQGRKTGAMLSVFQRIQRALKAFADALTGRGFFTAQDVFGRTLAGEIGKRHAGNTGSRRAAADRPVYNATRKPMALTSRRVTREQRAEGVQGEISQRLDAEMQQVGLSEAVRVEVVSRLMGKTTDGKKVALDARQRGRLIQVALDAEDPGGALNHEIIHLLRDPELWGAPYGLFTKAEWQSLVRASRNERRIWDRVKVQYPDLSARQQTEEVIAEMYREWSRTRPERMRPVATLLRRIRDFLSALGRAVTGSGYQTAHEVMVAIEGGVIGARAQARDAAGKFIADESGALRGLPERQKRRADPEGDAIGRRAIDEAMFFAQGVGGFAKKTGSNILNLRTSKGRSDKMTDLMVGSQGGRFSLLALVPGRQLLTDLARQIPAARRYDRLKQAMDTLRNEWQARMDDTAREWGRLAARDQQANNEMMAIMHEATISGVDPSGNAMRSRLTSWERRQLDERGFTGVSEDLRNKAESEQQAIIAYTDLRRRFAALPRAFRDLYRDKVQKDYQDQQDAFEEALIENIKKSQLAAEKSARRRYEQEMQKIRDDGLKGDEKKKAEEAARKKRDQATGAMQATMRTRIAELRLQFESAKLKGPYFPLSRFGDYFVTLRDEDGKIISFSMFETAAEQRAFVESDEAKEAASVEADVLDNEKTLQEQIAPTFMADIQKLLGDLDMDKPQKDQVMDEVWQRYLRTLPDASLRSRQIHRKGTPGFSHDAYRAFADHMFHGAHQLARLKYGVELTDALKDMRQQVPIADDRNRARAVVNEIEHRHAFTMKPTGAGWSQTLTQLSFVWFLAVTPGAAMVNLSQTTVVGPPILAARYQKGGFTGAVNELGKALKDYGRSRMDFSKPETLKKLSSDEKAAMQAAYDMGVVDKTQGHDLAQVAESGISYNAAQQTAMRALSWTFHSAEVMNRNITYLAAYRLARKEGMEHQEAVDSAADATWAIHFDYQNTSRPRFMQGDFPKVLFIFRNFTVNMLYRLARDTHQSLNGASPEIRKQARIQLAGVMASMGIHAGITGMPLYGLITMLLGAFFPGGDDDVERHLERMLMGDDDASALRRNIAGVALYGLPGHISGVSLSERIGMPNLWFREPYRDLDARGQVQHYMNEMLGPGIGLVADLAIGLHGLAFEPGNAMRDVERLVPKFIRDGLRAGRYLSEGVTTWRGDPIIEDVNWPDIFKQAIGFTPAAVAERYRQNSRMLNRQGRIQRERQDLTRAVVDAALRRERVSAQTLEEIMDFNRRFPEYAITRETVRRSLAARQSRAARGEFGVTLNTSLNRRIRTEEAPLLYGVG